MFTTLPNHSSDSAFGELLQYSSKALLRKREESQGSQQDANHLSPSNWYAAELDLSISNASLLMPLRERDMAVLTELFEDNEMGAIEADVLQNLRQLLPAPCWEDDPFSFLQDYL
jgi:hypothetical protein